MKLTGYQILHCDGGWRNFSFLKLKTDEGLTGISEFNECYGSPALGRVIEELVDTVLDFDPTRHEHIRAYLYAITRQAPGGMTQQAMAAIENALMDIKAKSLGVPVYELLGGAVRESMRLYWSHCGSYRLGGNAAHMAKAPLQSLEGLTTLGREVHDRGYTALKTNIFLFQNEPRMYMPGFARSGGWPELNPSRDLIRALREQLSALRNGAGPDVDILLDLNFNFKTEGFISVARGLDDLDLMWLEIDSYHPGALRDIRSAIRTPVASCESLYGPREFRPFFEARSMDVAIIDVPWNGIWESMKIAAMADAYEINVAPHNFYGNLCTLMSAHLCAAIPNFRIMEIDVDDVPWRDDLLTYTPEVEAGHLKLPPGPGWGAELNEAVIQAHPPTG